MKCTLVLLACVLAGATGTLVSPRRCNGPKLVCTLSSTTSLTLEGKPSSVSGEVQFYETVHEGKCQVAITGVVTGLGDDTPHGWHVHETPDISDPTGAAAGGHLNLEGIDHALPGSGLPRHTGDLGNLQPNENGIATLDVTYIKDRSTRDFKNRALIIHAAEDDGGQPTGNAGARLAQCIIKKQVRSKKCNGPKLKCKLRSTTSLTLEGKKSHVSGEVHFYEKSVRGRCQIAMRGTIKGLGDRTPHGWHVHETPDISDPAGLATGGHLNLRNTDHGLPRKDGSKSRKKAQKGGAQKKGCKKEARKAGGKKAKKSEGEEEQKETEKSEGEEEQKETEKSEGSKSSKTDTLLAYLMSRFSRGKVERHTGDLGNLYPNKKGVVNLRSMVVKGRTQNFKNRALIVHAAEDDGGQPTGNAGARLAQCVFEEE